MRELIASEITAYILASELRLGTVSSMKVLSRFVALRTFPTSL